MTVKCVEYPSSSEIPRAIPSCKSTISSSSGLLAQTSRRDRVLDGFPSFECVYINEQREKNTNRRPNKLRMLPGPCFCTLHATRSGHGNGSFQEI